MIRKILITLTLLSMMIVSGCSGMKFQIADTDTQANYLNVGTTCQIDQECVDYVNSQGGDGSPAKCVEDQCKYPAPDTLPPEPR